MRKLFGATYIDESSIYDRTDVYEITGETETEIENKQQQLFFKLATAWLEEHGDPEEFDDGWAGLDWNELDPEDVQEAVSVQNSELEGEFHWDALEIKETI